MILQKNNRPCVSVKCNTRKHLKLNRSQCKVTYNKTNSKSQYIEENILFMTKSDLIECSKVMIHSHLS